MVTFPATDWFPPVVPGRAAEIVELAREFRAALDEVPGALYQVGEAGLSDLMTQLMGVHFPVLRRWRPWS
ncbi:hypothetical protein EFY87_10620 [Flexivirga caeni]|uniref:Uncharacterized protein n=1 Tax=Flexivirga caeni TaxID=2294115 RepID=A0A3M9M7S2_9MICO|nr:hypothetical protein EFY87_10620 [Flexivirga caeni]